MADARASVHRDGDETLSVRVPGDGTLAGAARLEVDVTGLRLPPPVRP
jgi:hypothetical protein